MEKKQISIERFIKYMTSTKEGLMVPLVMTPDHNYSELNGKSIEELRLMVLDYITINQDDFFRIMSSIMQCTPLALLGVVGI